MSTSTWTTTTSATGLPTVETETCRTRHASFRHARADASPNSSPTGSRSNSPSPSSPSTTTVSLVIPKSKSFSASASPGGSGRSSVASSRKTSTAKSETSARTSVSGPGIAPERDDELTVSVQNAGSEIPPSLIKRLHITSDYESSDSPSSGEQSDCTSVLSSSENSRLLHFRQPQSSELNNRHDDNSTIEEVSIHSFILVHACTYLRFIISFI